MNILEHKINTLIVIATSFIVLSSPAEGRSHKSSEIITPIEPSSPYRYLGRFDIGKPSEISTMSVNTKTNNANGSGKVTPEINSKVENEEIQSALASLERAFNVQSRQSRDPSPDYNNNIPAVTVPHHHHPLVDHTHDHFHRHHHHSTEEHEHTR